MDKEETTMLTFCFVILFAKQMVLSPLAEMRNIGEKEGVEKKLEVSW